MYLYVTNAEDPDAAMALSLDPKDIQPQELLLDLAAESSLREPRIAEGRSETSASASDNENATRMILKTLAIGQIPEGYRFRHPGAGETIHCRQKHLLIQTRQVFYGQGPQIRVGILKNNGNEPQNRAALDSLVQNGVLSRQDLGTGRPTLYSRAGAGVASVSKVSPETVATGGVASLYIGDTPGGGSTITQKCEGCGGDTGSAGFKLCGGCERQRRQS